jgi:hypothetical protein
VRERVAAMGRRYTKWAALLGYALLAALFYAPILLGLRTFPVGDFTDHFLPFSLFQQQMLQAGQLPVWNPYTYAGHPFLADTQAAVFYPLSNLILALTWPWPAAATRLYFLQVEAVIHVVLAGFFVFLLVRRLTGQRWAAFCAGCCFAFSGYLTSYPPLQLAVLRTAVWLPLLLWILHCAFDQPAHWRLWLAAGVVAAVAVFAGHPQTWLHIAYTAAAYCLMRLVYTWQQSVRQQIAPFPVLAPMVGGLSIGLLAALTLSAAQWLPSLEFSQLSVRASVDYAFVSGGFPLQDAWQVLLPAVLTQYSPLNIGVIGLALALIGAGAWMTTPSRDSGFGMGAAGYDLHLLFYLALTMVALLLAFGGNGFLYPLFYRFAPGWSLFRGQERAALLVVLGLSVLAGYGMAAAPALALSRRRWLALVALAVVAAGVYAFGILWQFLGHSAIGNGDYLVIAFVTLALAATLAVLLQIPQWSGRRSMWVCALVVVNLFWANMTTNLDMGGPTTKTMLAPEILALETAVNERATANLGLPGRTYNEFRVFEDFGIRAGVEDVWGSSPLRLARYALLFDQFPLDRLWRLSGVEHLLTWRRELFEPSTLLAEFPQASDATYLHRLNELNPRAWLVRRLWPATDEEAIRLLGDHSFDVEQIALLPTETLTTEIDGGAVVPYAITLARPAANRLEVNVQSEDGGLLVISENWMPGWRVEECRGEQFSVFSDRSSVLGLQPLSVYRTNLTLLGVPLPAGADCFALVYWPDSVRLGLWISAGALALFVVTVSWRVWRMRRYA